ncbi:MAG TPA: carboxypeptidase regulatory-like domain-containing protein, partial [Candidatus Solibacter sp.]|nr:carboxypeptidase regulatory-like domain-containing protein [Candidatus Solibacter sp.]
MALLGTIPINAQSDARSTILGRVSDPAGAAVVGASVLAENTDTGVHYTAVANASGDYLLPFLIPGPYSLTVESSGFKKSVRPHILVRFEERITIDVTLEIGAVTETLQVTAEAPLMDSSTVSMGQVLANKTVTETPLIAGNATVMASYSPGVLFMPTYPKDVRPFDTGSGSAVAGDGTLLGTAQFLLDGAANNQLVDKGFSYEPPQGAIQEVKVQTASFDASYGYWTGVTLNVSLKSGANTPHGQAYYFNQNPAVDANQFFANQFGSAKYLYKAHRWGGVFTGPVYLPKLYNGRNKTFFMYGYEGMWTFDPVSIGFESEPTPAQRTGNFSDLLALGTKYQIYDPYSTVPAGGGLFNRTPVPNNIIPASQINPVGAAIIKLYDLPNRAGTADGTNNYTNGRNSHDTFYNHIIRIDQNLSDKQRFFVRVDATQNQRKQDQRHHDALGHLMYRRNQPGAAFDHVYTFSPTLFINTRYSYTRYVNPTTPNQLGWDLAGMGFSPTFISQINAQGAGYLRLPQIAASNGLATGAGGYSALSIQTNIFNPGTTHDFAANATKIHGTHTLRFGVGYRVYENNVVSLGNSSGLFTFASTWLNGPVSTSAVAPAGQGMASLLYGLPTAGSFSTFASNFAESDKIFATYLQDDWKVSRRLTLSLGLRYELPTPMTERFNRSVLSFNPTAVNPVSAGAAANYAQNPIPQVAPSQFQALGGLTFPGVNGNSRSLWNYNYTNLMPRFGFAYSVTPDTIIRGGYGIYFEPLGTPAFDVNQTGFSATTQMVISTDNGQHYVSNITNPFPNGLTPPLGAAGGYSTNLGQNITINNQNLKTPYSQRWQFAVQRSLPANSVIEVSYVGNRGVRQLIMKNLDALPDQYLSTSPVRDQNTINFLGAQVANPFFPL